jgi:hypothetical protein
VARRSRPSGVHRRRGRDSQAQAELAAHVVGTAGKSQQSNVSNGLDHVVVRVIEHGTPGGPAVVSTQVVPLR